MRILSELVKTLTKTTAAVSLAAILAVLAVSPVTARQPSEVVQAFTITSPTAGATVGSQFTLNGTFRSDLGCRLGPVTVEAPPETPDTVQADATINGNTFSYSVDLTKPLLLNNGAASSTRLAPGTHLFRVNSVTPNCDPASVSLTVQPFPVGGVATGDGGTS